MKHVSLILSVIMAALFFLGLSAASACPLYVGDYVWYDRNGNGLQDEDASDGLNGVRVNLYRDYGCDGIIDGGDGITDYDYTHDGPDGFPGYYDIQAFSSSSGDPWCYVAFVDETTLPNPDLFPTTPQPLSFGTLCEDKWDVDFGFTDEVFQPECGECEGKVTQLTLQYNGDAEAYIEVEQKKEGFVFAGLVAPGETFTFDGVDKKGTLGTEISVFVDGALQVKIHTSCSQPIGIGSVFGDFEVTDGYSREGGRLCPDEQPGGNECGECEGKVSRLTLLYRGGGAQAYVEVEQKKEGFVFGGLVAPGEAFSFNGVDKKETLGTEISVFVEGVLQVKIHTSCSQPIGIGSIYGDFEVIDGASREGGPFCPVEEADGHNYSE